MYFLRVDYIYCGSPVQRFRILVNSFKLAQLALKDFIGEDYLVLQVKIEKCV